MSYSKILEDGTYRVTSTFSDPRDGGSRIHEAIDVAVATGSPVRSFHGGIVETSNNAGDPAGLWVRVYETDSGGLVTGGAHITSYCHLSTILVQDGSWIGPGAIVGYSGSSGKSKNGSGYRPHLHLAIRQFSAPSRVRESILTSPSEFKKFINDIDAPRIDPFSDEYFMAENSSILSLTSTPADRSSLPSGASGASVEPSGSSDYEGDGGESYYISDDVTAVESSTLDLTGFEVPDDSWRLEGGPGAFQLGDIFLEIPPSQIKVYEVNGSDRYVTLRTAGSPKIRTTREEIRIDFQFYVPDADAFNSNFRKILAQFKRTPITVIRNEFVSAAVFANLKTRSDKSNIHSFSKFGADSIGFIPVILDNISISSIPDFPQTYIAQCTCYLFNALPFGGTLDFIRTEKAASDQIKYLLNKLDRLAPSMDNVAVGLSSLDPRDSFPYRKFYRSLLEDTPSWFKYPLSVNSRNDVESAGLMTKYSLGSDIVFKYATSYLDLDVLRQSRNKSLLDQFVVIQKALSTIAQRPSLSGWDDVDSRTVAQNVASSEQIGLGSYALHGRLGLLSAAGASAFTTWNAYNPFGDGGWFFETWASIVHSFRLLASADDEVTVRTRQLTEGTSWEFLFRVSDETGNIDLENSGFEIGELLTKLKIDPSDTILLKDGVLNGAKLFEYLVQDPADRDVLIGIIDGSIEETLRTKQEKLDVQTKEINLSSNYLITSFSANYQNVFAQLPIVQYNIPTYQHIAGGEFTNIQLVLRTDDEERVNAIKLMGSEMSQMRRMSDILGPQYKFDIPNAIAVQMAGVGVGNILTAMGIHKVLVKNVEYATVPNLPGVYEITLDLWQAEIDVKEYESLLSENNEFDQIIFSILNYLHNLQKRGAGSQDDGSELLIGVLATEDDITDGDTADMYLFRPIYPPSNPVISTTTLRDSSSLEWLGKKSIRYVGIDAPEIKLEGTARPFSLYNDHSRFVSPPTNPEYQVIAAGIAATKANRDFLYQSQCEMIPDSYLERIKAAKKQDSIITIRTFFVYSYGPDRTSSRRTLAEIHTMSNTTTVVSTGIVNVKLLELSKSTIPEMKVSFIDPGIPYRNLWQYLNASPRLFGVQDTVPTVVAPNLLLLSNKLDKLAAEPNGQLWLDLVSEYGQLVEENKEVLDALANSAAGDVVDLLVDYGSSAAFSKALSTLLPTLVASGLMQKGRNLLYNAETRAPITSVFPELNVEAETARSMKFIATKLRPCYPDLFLPSIAKSNIRLVGPGGTGRDSDIGVTDLNTPAAFYLVHHEFMDEHFRSVVADDLNYRQSIASLDAYSNLIDIIAKLNTPEKSGIVRLQEIIDDPSVATINYGGVGIQSLIQQGFNSVKKQMIDRLSGTTPTSQAMAISDVLKVRLLVATVTYIELQKKMSPEVRAAARAENFAQGGKGAPEQEGNAANARAELLMIEGRMQKEIKALNNLIESGGGDTAVDNALMYMGIYSVSGEDSKATSAMKQKLMEAKTHVHLNSVASAFPTFRIYFIEEDSPQWMLFDDFYSYSAVKDITIVKNKWAASDVCTITLSNLTGVLSDVYVQEETENLLGQQNIKTMFLRPGTRIMVRLGFSNNPLNLPIRFDGAITDVQIGDETQIIAQSWGVELTEMVDSGGVTKYSSHKWYQPFGQTDVGGYGNVASAILDSIPGGRHLGSKSLLSADPDPRVAGRIGRSWSERFASLLFSSKAAERFYRGINPRDDNIFLNYDWSYRWFDGEDLTWYVVNQTAWEALHELSLYQNNYVLTVRPYNEHHLPGFSDVRQTVYLGPTDGMYKAMDYNNYGSILKDESERQREEFAPVIKAFKLICGIDTTEKENVFAKAFAGGNARELDMFYGWVFARGGPNISDIPSNLSGDSISIGNYGADPNILWIQTDINRLSKYVNFVLGNSEILDSAFRIFDPTNDYFFTNFLIKSQSHDLTLSVADDVAKSISTDLRSNRMRAAVGYAAPSKNNSISDVFANFLCLFRSPFFKFMREIFVKTNSALIVDSLMTQSALGLSTQQTLHRTLSENGYEFVRRHHVATSSNNIVYNHIRASADSMYNKVVIKYPKDGSQAVWEPGIDVRGDDGYNTYSTVVDNDLDPDYVREYNAFAKNVDTGLVDSILVGRALRKASKNGVAVDDDPNLVPSFVKVGNNMLKEGMEGMYDGEICIIGNPYVNPYDVCLDASTLIHTESGLKPISEIVIGDNVFTHNNRLQRVNTLFKSSPTGKFYRVKCKTDPDPLLITGNHPVLALDRLSVFNDSKPWTHRRISGFVPSFRRVDSLTVKDYIAVPRLLSRMSLPVSLARLIGYYLAEGSIIWEIRRAGSSEGSCGTKVPVGVSLSFDGVKEHSILEEINNLLKDVGCENPANGYYYSNRNQGLTVTFYDRTLAESIVAIAGYNTATCRDGKWLRMFYDAETTFNILGTYFNGNGCYVKYHTQVGRLSASTTSLNLGRNIRQLLINVGIPATCSVRPNKSPLVAKDSVIYSVGVASFYSQLLIPYTRFPNSPNEQIRTNSTTLVDENYMYLMVDSVEEIERPEWVYNIDVAEDHSYVAANKIVHNCHIYDEYNDMSGMVEVEQVIESFSFADGYLTKIKPALLCRTRNYSSLMDDSYLNHVFSWATTAAAGRFIGIVNAIPLYASFANRAGISNFLINGTGIISRGVGSVTDKVFITKVLRSVLSGVGRGFVQEVTPAVAASAAGVTPVVKAAAAKNSLKILGWPFVLATFAYSGYRAIQTFSSNIQAGIGNMFGSESVQFNLLTSKGKPLYAGLEGVHRDNIRIHYMHELADGKFTDAIGSMGLFEIGLALEDSALPDIGNFLNGIIDINSLPKGAKP